MHFYLHTHQLNQNEKDCNKAQMQIVWTQMGHFVHLRDQS